MNSYVPITAFVLIVMACLDFGTVEGQSYHFSNGWNPGKRSSMSTETCHFRTDVQTLVFKLIEDEVLRMLSDPACFGGLPSLRNLLKKDIGYPPIDERK
ncbi:prepro-gonadotropin-releasing hormone-like protein [Mya arenaria]|uniref:prepro-gonadotropin-releasing hormone-like protein n=1 Tax=Mya arenaria TaxID=6604 RepID=UPI0022DEFF7D|nr:prepro-gonadotropin-releasing hormone-like protein [Mya arenaria]XP_052773348.1 prepro-gonadotropin-releasing hormone-like protein [Mya arenaria]XP_052821498.1 prepro-gonadotropin-releasing hormone-like protein [Mya arenaria]XP_052821499.1 prepro-gonadotropin-releasing hormone-like protein [Mya arenaria]